MENLHFIRVKYLPATNTKGSRVKIISDRLRETVTIPYDYSLNSSIDIAVQYLENIGVNIVGQCELHGYDGVIARAVNGQFQSIKA